MQLACISCGGRSLEASDVSALERELGLPAGIVVDTARSAGRRSKAPCARCNGPTVAIALRGTALEQCTACGAVWLMGTNASSPSPHVGNLSLPPTPAPTPVVDGADRPPDLPSFSHENDGSGLLVRAALVAVGALALFIFVFVALPIMRGGNWQDVRVADQGYQVRMKGLVRAGKTSLGHIQNVDLHAAETGNGQMIVLALPPRPNEKDEKATLKSVYDWLLSEVGEQHRVGITSNVETKVEGAYAQAFRAADGPKQLRGFIFKRNGITYVMYIESDHAGVDAPDAETFFASFTTDLHS